MKVLFVDGCVSQRGDRSRTLRLCRSFLDALVQARPDCALERLRLSETPLPPFTVERLNERDALAQAGRFDAPMFALARQFREADGIVVGAPYWDLTYPALLKLYIEHISANGLCYAYDERGPHGLCRARWLCYLTTGGDFARADSLGVLHWEQLCRTLFGIPRYESVFAGGLDADPENAGRYLDEACERARTLARELAK